MKVAFGFIEIVYMLIQIKIKLMSLIILFFFFMIALFCIYLKEK